MRAWIFTLLLAGPLLAAPDKAFRGGAIEDNPDSVMLLVVVMVVVALIVRPIENGWSAISAPLGFGGCVVSVLMWGTVISFALWLMAGTPNGGGL